MFRVAARQMIVAMPLFAAFVAPIFAAPLAGSAIDNSAAAQYVASGTASSQQSNTVRALVQATHAVFQVQLRVLSGSTSGAAVDQPVTLALSAANTGIDSTGVQATVDGNTQTLVLLTQAIPANTTFVSAEAPAGATLLYHRRNDAQRVFVRTAPQDLREIDAFAYAFSTFTAGQSSSGTFIITRNTGAVLDVETSSQVWYEDSSTPGVDVITSNVVKVSFAKIAPTIRFYTNNTFGQIAPATAVIGPLHIEVAAVVCNMSATVVDTIQVTLISKLIGDWETFTAVETGPDTGLFRVASSVLTESSKQHNKNPNDGELGTIDNDTLQATISGCGDNTATGSILVDPYGVVFDSSSNAPVANAIVSLIDIDGTGNGGNAGGLARVFLDDGVTAAPNVVTTGADGEYHFPLVGASRYRLQVKTPVGYSFASKIAPTQLPAGRTISSASYGGEFAISTALGAVQVDVPVDPGAVDGLLVEKTASRNNAEIGDFVDYTVQIKNTAGITFNNVVLHDTLPTGFAYVPGSLRRNAVRAADPPGRGPQLEFNNVGALSDGATIKLTYRVRIGPGAQLGDNINRAQASNAAPLAHSNIAEARVKVEGGVFSDRGFVLGKIFADCNGDRIQDSDEPGVAGVKVWLEDGTYAISDGLGKFSFYGLSPRTHIAKIDRATAPPGAIFEVLDQRNANVGDSRFIDLKNGELARADFAISNCDAPMLDTLAQRRAVSEQRGGEIEAGLAVPLTLDDNAAIDPRSRAASGVIDATKVDPQQLAAAVASVEAQQFAQRPLADIAGAVDNKLGFVGLSDGSAVTSAQQRILVKGLLGATLSIVVNGQPVADSQLGTRVERAEQQLELLEYIGVELQPGNNTLTLEQRDPFGNLRASQTIQVRAPGELQRLRIEQAPMPATDKSSGDVKISVYLEDRNGVPVAARTPLTLETDNGTWSVEDSDPNQLGAQVFVEGGRGEFTLRTPEQPGTANVKVSSNNLHAETRVDFLPTLRDMVAAGLIEGTLNLKKLGSGALQPARNQDGFEQELKQFSADNGRAAARAALFLKGKIKGDYLLTLGYDSDKETRERLFRDIQPDQFYPVYGDASIKGYDAQSTQKLYVRIDKNKSWLLYGDFTTPIATATRSLTAYNRSLTGIREHYETEKIAVNTFASRDSTQQVIEEIRANGTSGPYLLSNNNLIENSEQIEIITRDRDQPAVIIKSVPLTRFSDYELEAFTGRILFRNPIASVDADLNPQSIRATYEVDSGGATFWVGGVDAQLQVTEHVAVGAIDIEDRDPSDTAALRGANMTVKVGGTVAIAELAHSDKFSIGTGDAQRVEIKRDSENLQARIYAGRADADFYNPSALLSRGHSEGGAQIARKLDDSTRLTLDAIHSGDLVSEARREGVLAGVEHAFAHNVKLEVGVRRTHEVAGSLSPANSIAPSAGIDALQSISTVTAATVDSAAPGTTADTTSVRAKLGAPVPGVSAASVYGEAEQALDDADKKLVAVGGEYRLADKGRLYGRHEFISSLSGPYAFDTNQRRDTTVFGIDNEYMKDGRAYSEYRARDAFSGREAEAAMGLKNLWTVAEGVRVNTSAERVRAIAGDDDGAASALAGGIEYTRNPNWKGSARLEWRTAPGSTSILNTLGLARKINEEWTLLGRNILNRIDSSGPNSGDRLQDRLQVGFAYRDATTNIWNGLGRYEFKHEQDDTPATGFWHQAHIVALQANIQPQHALVFSARYAGKYAIDQSDGIDSRSVVHLVAGRVTRDIAEHWDIGVQVSSLFSVGSHQDGLGAEIGYQVQDNLWVSAGYNIFGFHDRDLSAEDNTERGAYLRMRFKFDENAFSRFN